MGVYTRVDERSDWVVAHNRLIDRDAGNNAQSATQIRWTQYGGVEIDPRTGATLSSNNHTLKIRSTVGKHRATLLAATSATATPSAANSVVLEEDDGLFIGAGKALRLYDAAGTDYAQLTSDADGGLVVGGSGASAGAISAGALSATSLTLAGNLTFTGSRRILADFSNGTYANRTLFQTSTVNGFTGIDAIPNGTGAGAAFEVFSTSNPAASARLILYAGATEHYLLSDHLGAAYLPLLIHVGGLERIRVATTGQVLIGDSANTGMTQGLTINQGASDDEILALKSSDIAHGVTLVAETDTYAAMQKDSATNGGLRLTALDDTASRALRVRAVATTANTTRATTADGAIVTDSYLKSGTGTTTLGANGNLLVVRDNDLARFLVDAEGDVHYDGTTNAAAWDDHDDVALLEALRITTAPGVERGYISRFSDDVRRHADVLARTGVLTLNDDGHHFISTKGLNGLLIDAIRQLAGRLTETQAEVRALRGRD